MAARHSARVAKQGDKVIEPWNLGDPYYVGDSHPKGNAEVHSGDKRGVRRYAYYGALYAGADNR